MYSLAIFLSVFAISCGYVHCELFELEERGGSSGYCKAINAAVKNNPYSAKVTTFCSSFLHIPTVTSTRSITSVVTETTIDTSSVTESVTTTLTETLTFTEFTAVETLPTIVASETTTFAATTTITTTSTPSTVTTTVTTHTTANFASKRSVAVAKPYPTPGCFKGFAKNALSSACSCLSIPKPRKTVTQTILSTTTVGTTISETATSTFSETGTSSVTSTVQTTSYTPVTTTFSTTETMTITQSIEAPTPTATYTVKLPYSPKCVDVLLHYKIFVTVSIDRSYTYPFATVPMPGNGDEQTFSECCQLCYDTPDCAFYYAYPASQNNWRCQRIYSTSDVMQNNSPQCPKGRLTPASASNPRNQWTQEQPRGIGPCFGYNTPDN